MGMQSVVGPCRPYGHVGRCRILWPCEIMQNVMLPLSTHALWTCGTAQPLQVSATADAMDLFDTVTKQIDQKALAEHFLDPSFGFTCGA